MGFAFLRGKVGGGEVKWSDVWCLWVFPMWKNLQKYFRKKEAWSLRISTSLGQGAEVRAVWVRCMWGWEGFLCNDRDMTWLCINTRMNSNISRKQPFQENIKRTYSSCFLSRMDMGATYGGGTVKTA